MKKGVLGLIAVSLLVSCEQGKLQGGLTFPESNKQSSLQIFSHALSSSEKECISFNKQKMQKSINFLNSMGDAETDAIIKTVNGFLSLSLSAAPEYAVGIDQENSQVSQVELIRAFKTPDNREILFRQDLNYTDNDVSTPFELSVSVSVTNFRENTKLKITQKYSVAPSCRSDLKVTVSTSFIEANQVVHIDEKTLSGNSIGHRTADIRLANDQKYIIDADMFSFARHTNDVYYLNIDQPIVSAVRQTDLVNERMDPLDKVVKKIAGKRWTLFNETSPIANVESFVASDSKFRFYSLGNVEFQIVTEQYWNNLVPSTAESLASQKVKLTKLRQRSQRPMEITLLIDRPLDFSNFAIYWDKMEESQNLGDSLPYKYILRNREINYNQDSVHISEGLSGSNSNPNLSETYFLQTSLPEIQEMSAKLKENFDGTRIQMVKKILVLIGQNLNYEVGTKRVISVNPLRTEEVLKNHQGVSQNFANLFATLSRSVGIPTRVISGFSLNSDSLDAYVWNEVEIREGVWIPVDPQFQTLIFDTASYLPMAISLIFDSQNFSDLRAQELKTLKLTNFSVEN